MADRRGQGFGEAITRKLLAQARDDGAKAVYLLTDTAAPFFKKLGFRTIARDAAPSAILATRQAASLCPASAALMARDLPA
jgi:N-acetylglutamate synthase-like GNAT family acetyltransferase